MTMKFFERRKAAAAEAQGAALTKYRRAVHRAAGAADLDDDQGQQLLEAALAAGVNEADVPAHVEAVRTAQQLAAKADQHGELVETMKAKRAEADDLRVQQQAAVEKFGRQIGEAEAARVAATTAADEATAAGKELDALRARYPQLFE
jgi:hypothetical protein